MVSSEAGYNSAEAGCDGWSSDASLNRSEAETTLRCCGRGCIELAMAEAFAALGSVRLSS